MSGRIMRRFAAVLLAALACAVAQPQLGPDLNKPERLEWFRDQGFGLFIHWSLDSQLGTVISHSMVGGRQEIRREVAVLPPSCRPIDRSRHRQDSAADQNIALCLLGSVRPAVSQKISQR